MLTAKQQEIISDFYRHGPTRVVYDKTERNGLWNLAKNRIGGINASMLEQKCPALAHQIEKSYQSGANIQSAVFSECSYAQTLAGMMQLNDFTDCSRSQDTVNSSAIKSILISQNIVPRYCYDGKDNILIQAGGHGGIDCVLVDKNNHEFYTIEFKEPGAKTSEPDLPKYREDGKMRITPDFLIRYPQFKDMLNEQKDLNFFGVMGSNINNFSPRSVEIAVSDNYDGAGKTADVICTEDQNGYLVMIPSNQVSKWAEIVGEIRPAGRNHYNVWTPEALNKFLVAKGATIVKNVVAINKNRLEVRKERGGGGKISGYKINPLFFVYSKDCQERAGQLIFNLDKVQQLNPTIAGKMFFKDLSYYQVKNYYT